jgi:hypothetical protein
MTDQVEYAMPSLERLRSALRGFLEEECSSLCLDDADDRETFIDKLAAWLLKDKTVDMTPEDLLPKARYCAGINIMDEVTGERIVKLLLYRSEMMTDGDFLQMQNWFWSTIGRAIRDNPELAQTLRVGGVIIDTDPEAGGQQFAP